MRISVIIPTYNRCDYLKKTLSSLLDQSLSTCEYEIIVVNDGSQDGTKTFMWDFIKNHSNIVYLEQSNKGPASARNRGIAVARGKYIFFTGDDIIASRDLLKEHLDFLEAHENIAVLGYTDWARAIKVSRFMEFLMDRGHQFNYLGVKDGQPCAWGLFFTSNVSLGKRWLENELFDENLPYPIWEDSELGYRLCKKGLKIIFNGNARAFHNHIITEEGFYNKIRQSGMSRVYFYSKHPELKTFLFCFAKNRIVLFALRILKYFEGILKFFGLRVLAWELNIFYYIALGIHHEMKRQKDICKRQKVVLD